MIGYDLSRVSGRQRIQYYNLFSPSGRAHLANLLNKEIESLGKFVMSYETPELRRLQAKSRRAELTPEEQQMLKEGSKSFKGLLDTGELVEDARALKVIEEYMRAEQVAEADYKTLESFTELEEQQNSEIVLGRQLSYWNLHPNQFPESVYEVIFDAPDYVKQEIVKIFNIKAGSLEVVQPPKVFKDKGEVELLIRDLNYTDEEHNVLVKKLLDLRVVGDATFDQYRETLISAIKTVATKDAEFDFEVYEKLKGILPNYHNQKTKYFIYMLAQYNYTQNVAVSSRLDFDTLHAFYRKADELCS